MRSEFVNYDEHKVGQIDWSVPQIVKNVNTGLLVMTDGKNTKTTFCGTVIYSHHVDTSLVTREDLMFQYFKDFNKKIYEAVDKDVVLKFTK